MINKHKSLLFVLASILILLLIAGVDTTVSAEKCEDVMIVVCKMSSDENRIEVYRSSGSSTASFLGGSGADCATAISNVLKDGFCIKDVSVKAGFHFEEKSANKTIKEKHSETLIYYTLVKYAPDDCEKKPKKPEAPGY